LSLAFARPDGTYSVIILNDNRMEKAVRFADLPAPIAEVVVTTETAYDVVVIPGADAMLVLPPLSIASLILRP